MFLFGSAFINLQSPYILFLVGRFPLIFGQFFDQRRFTFTSFILGSFSSAYFSPRVFNVSVLKNLDHSLSKMSCVDFFEPSSFAIPNFHDAVLKSCRQNHKHFSPEQKIIRMTKLSLLISGEVVRSNNVITIKCVVPSNVQPNLVGVTVRNTILLGKVVD